MVNPIWPSPSASRDFEPFWPFQLPEKGPDLVLLKEGFTPQGQGYDSVRKEILTSYYKDGKGVTVSIQNKDQGSGDQVHNVILAGSPPGPGERPGEPNYQPPGTRPGDPKHGGGVATDGEFVYLADTGGVYVYRRSDIDHAGENGAAYPVTFLKTPSEASYLTVHEGKLYVGTYTNGEDKRSPHLYRYDINPDSKDPNTLLGDRKGPIVIPQGVQGLVVTDQGLLFSSSEHLQYMPIIDTNETFSIKSSETKHQPPAQSLWEVGNGQIGKYAQGINIIGDELWITYESGSDQYKENVENPVQSIQRIPLTDLGDPLNDLTRFAT